jgi:hypothetical protein
VDEALIGFIPTTSLPNDWGYTIKHATIVEYAKIFGLNILVETGTYLGLTVSAMLPYFSNIYSIELGLNFYARAKYIFNGNPKVHLFLGDSGKVLKEMLPLLTKKPLFWLDAHYSAGDTARGDIDTPILQELDTIFSLCPSCVILIDDAREFNGINSYPTLPDLESYVLGRLPTWVFEIKDDIIRLHEKTNPLVCRFG